jgi:2-polyprenyl-6-hydroxyphenyl methylase/3-demethylubiquinone-9 3-methyltransferase
LPASTVNAPLIDLAQERATEGGFTIDFRVGSATELPWLDGSFDVCCMPELLEHVAEWEKCLLESVRCLRPGGALYLTTSNKLCPVQQEFNLPLYSWYPGFLKRRYERLAVTTRPEIVNHATCPAVNWFSFYQLRRFLAPHGFRCLDRFDVLSHVASDPGRQLMLALIRHVPGFRLLGQMMTQGTVILAIRDR